MPAGVSVVPCDRLRSVAGGIPFRAAAVARGGGTPARRLFRHRHPRLLHRIWNVGKLWRGLLLLVISEVTVWKLTQYSKNQITIIWKCIFCLCFWKVWLFLFYVIMKIVWKSWLSILLFVFRENSIFCLVSETASLFVKFLSVIVLAVFGYKYWYGLGECSRFCFIPLFQNPCLLAFSVLSFSVDLQKLEDFSATGGRGGGFVYFLLLLNFLCDQILFHWFSYYLTFRCCS